jgi:hypothetical protein
VAHAPKSVAIIVTAQSAIVFQSIELSPDRLFSFGLCIVNDPSSPWNLKRLKTRKAGTVVHLTTLPTHQQRKELAAREHYWHRADVAAV